MKKLVLFTDARHGVSMLHARLPPPPPPRTRRPRKQLRAPAAEEPAAEDTAPMYIHVMAKGFQTSSGKPFRPAQKPREDYGVEIYFDGPASERKSTRRSTWSKTN